MWLHSLNLSFFFFFGLGGKRGGFFFIDLAINLHPARWKPFALPPGPNPYFYSSDRFDGPSSGLGPLFFFSRARIQKETRGEEGK